VGEKLPRVARDAVFAYSLRYPDGWRTSSEPTRGSPRALTGRRRVRCLATGTSRLPDWGSEEARLRFYREQARKRRFRSDSIEALKGANSEGVTAVLDGGPLIGRSSTFGSGGVGVTVFCSAPAGEFERLDEDVFRPMAESVRVRRDERAEAVQPELAALEGVEAAGVLLRRGTVRAELVVARRSVGVEAVKEALRLLVSELPGRRVGVTAVTEKDPVNPVVGNYDPRTGGAFVQAIPNPPERFRLEP
jgi:hypothetical protein